MTLSTSTIAFLLACVLVGGYVWNRSRWSRVPLERLTDMARGTDSGRWKGSLRELQRRGVDVAPHVARLAGLLLSPALADREAAHSTLTDLFPEWQRDLDACGYQPQDGVAVARAKLHPVFQHLQVRPNP